MNRHPLPLLAGSIAAIAVAGRMEAQRLPTSGQAFAGVEWRSLTFDRLPGVRRLSQLAVPFGVVAPFGRLTIDLGTAWVSTRLERPDGSRHPVDDFTDTQARASYIFGRDAVVATVAVNLPTGPQRATAKDYTVIGAVSPSFLGFPAAAYASGFSVTSGLAGAIQAGQWSLGLAGSIRVSRRFTPYADAVGAITYKPGLEGRVRAGADGLVGSSRLSLGFTYSTFGDDQFGLNGSTRGQYRPGPRWVAEAALVAPLGGSTLSLTAFDFHRAAGDTTGVTAKNRENLAAGELSVSIPLADWLAFEPVAAGRVSKPEVGSGRMTGAGAGFRIRLGGSVWLSPQARYDRGWVKDATGTRNDFRGGSVSGYLRVSF